MNDLVPIIEKLRQQAVQSGYGDVLAHAVPIAILVLIAGVGISVLGAKLARPGATLVLALAGAAFGVAFARQAGFPAPLGGLVAAAMFGVIAHMTFPIWVGVATAAVFSSAALGTLGHERVLPHYPAFAQMSPAEVVGSVQFAVPTPEQQEVYLTRTPREYIQGFWDFVTHQGFWNFVAQRDSSVVLDGKLLGIGVAITGLFLGVVAARWMLILSTSLMGTALVVFGVARLLGACFPESYQALNHPTAMGMCAGGFIVTSLVVQTLLTRKAPSEKTGRAARA